MLDESICHFWAIGSICHFYSILVEILLPNNVDLDQTPYFVASDLGVHSWSISLLRLSR